jgi:nicotinate-nucleotide pyrophosphorylase (carboxylating)
MTMTSPPPVTVVRDLVARALAEDIGHGDISTEALFSEPIAAMGTIMAEEHDGLVVAGVAIVREVFAQVDPSLRLTARLADGQRAEAGSVILTVRGDGRSILKGERVALNFLQRLSGIATLTSRFCEAVKKFPVRIVDTRKTTPGLRALEKWAVALGGGSNHRFGLADGLLIKDNHLSLAAAWPGLTGPALTRACRKARERAPHGLKLEVEAQTLDDVRAALDGGADIILLDNMDVPTIRKAVELIKKRALVEASGGVTLATVRDIAAAGADLISVGALTHSAPAANLSLDLMPDRSRRSRTRS